MQQRSIVEDIKNRIIADKSGRTYVDLMKSLNLVSERIFARSTHFILELIQKKSPIQAIAVASPYGEPLSCRQPAGGYPVKFSMKRRQPRSMETAITAT